MADDVTCWALLDAVGNYCGGICTDGTPPSKTGDNPEGYREVRVPRFPKAYEKWDDSRGWISDGTPLATQQLALRRLERNTELRQANRIEFRRMIIKEAQELVYESLTTLFPGLQITEEQKAKLFPLLGDLP